MRAVAPDGSFGDRVDALVRDDEDGWFRDGLVGAAMTAVIVLVCLLAVATAVAVRWWSGGRGLVVGGALVLVGFLDATYLAAPLGFARNGGEVAYWAFLAVVAVAVAAVCLVAGRALGHPIDPLLVGLGSIVALHLVDLVTGAHLEWNSVFGYSPTIGIRFSGQGNLAFAQLSAATVLFAGLLAWRLPGTVGRRVALGLLVVTVVVMGAPFWGNDFGSVLSAVPAFALMAWLLTGHRLTPVRLLGVLIASVGAVVTVGLLDVLRPHEDRTHVGRFFGKLANDPDAALLALRRKASGNLAALGGSVLLGAVIVAVVLLAWLWFVRPPVLRDLPARITTTGATSVGFVAVAVLGFLLNDSGITIPGMMCAVLIAVIAFLAVTVLAPDALPAPASETPPGPVTARAP